MSDEPMPPDPFVPVPGSGFFSEVIAEAVLLWDALEEARSRGALFDAVLALDENQLRTLVTEVALREAWRRRRFGMEPGE